jgi:hypothetical protein
MGVVERERGILLEAEGRARGNRGVAGKVLRSMRPAAVVGDHNLVEADIGPEERLEEHRIVVGGREAVGSPEAVRREAVVHMRRKAAL